MHHPRREPGAMPCPRRIIVPGVIDCFNSDRFRSAHLLNGRIDQEPARASPSEFFGNIQRVDDSNSARFDERRNGFPVINPSDEKSGDVMVDFRNEAEALSLAESGIEPLLHFGVGMRFQSHIRTCHAATVIKPSRLDLRQIFPAPLTYVDFHCEFQNKLR